MKSEEEGNKKHTQVILYKANKEEQLDKYFQAIVEGFQQTGLKQVSSQFMYDEEGSRLCAAINQTEQYYVWRCQKELLQTHAEAMLQAMRIKGKTENQKFNIIDLGAGDASKTKILLEVALRQKYNFEYIPIDISIDSNRTLCKNLAQVMPDMQMTLITSTFEDGVKWVRQNKKDQRNLFMFMGGTIGSWDEEGLNELVQFYSSNLKKGDIMAVGFDKIKDPYLMQKAYSNDNKLQNAFMLNNLTRINKQLGANFILENFYPHAYYDPNTHYIYVSLISRIQQSVRIRDKEFTFKEAEVIRFHRSRKWLIEEADQLFEKGGFTRVAQFEDSKKYFCYLFFEKGTD